MTISSYQVDTVLRVYTRQNSAKSSTAAKTGMEQPYQDKVTLTAGEPDKNRAYEKISYNLLDIILSNKAEE